MTLDSIEVGHILWGPTSFAARLPTICVSVSTMKKSASSLDPSEHRLNLREQDYNVREKVRLLHAENLASYLLGRRTPHSLR